MKRKMKAIFLPVFVSFWLLAFGLGTEMVLRAYDRAERQEVAQRLWPEIQKYMAADDSIFQKARAISPPPDTVPWNAPDREAFLEGDETGRRALAIDRHELILTCDKNGKILSLYPCETPWELKEISSHVKPGDSIAALLPQAEFADAMESIRQSRNEEKPVRDYDVPLKNASSHLIEFNAMRITEEPLAFALFLGNSRYQEFMRRYRPHIYRRNWYMAQFIHSEFWTNSLGFRDREVDLPKPAGRLRIVCIGGSTTVEGPHNTLTYPKLLEGMLRREFSTDSIEVINCGVDGMAFPGELERMSDWLQLEPDMIIHYNIINNASWLIQKALEKAREEEEIREKIKEIADRSVLISKIGQIRFSPATEYYVQVLEEAAIAQLSEMNRIARQAGISMAVASFAIPDPARISTQERQFFESTFHLPPDNRGDVLELRRLITEYNRLLKEFSSREGILYIPVAEGIYGGIETFTDVCHLRMPGIERKASIMFETLKPFVSECLNGPE